MSYLIINKYPVFLSSNKYSEIEDEVCTDKDPRWRISSTIQGHIEAKEKHKLIYQSLKQKYDFNPSKFIVEWVKFDFKEEEARENVWDLIYDYSSLYGFSFLEDMRGSTDKFLEDYLGLSMIYPMGKTFVLAFSAKQSPIRLKKFFSKNISLIRLAINIECVKRIIGELSDFIIDHNNIRIRCYQNLEIIPISIKNKL